MKPIQRTFARQLCAALLCLLLCFQLSACASMPGFNTGTSKNSSSASVSSGTVPSSSGVQGEEEPISPFTPTYLPLAEAAILVNAETGAVVYEKNADAQYQMASLVKMMTCILTAERVENLDTSTVTANESTTWIYDILYEYSKNGGAGASTADIRQGETLTVRELLYAALLPSANEAALLLAHYVSGGYMENFMYMMNARAESLGCTGTYFADANGLSSENLTTARDMALITAEFMRFPELIEIAGTFSFEMPVNTKHSRPYWISSTNLLLREAGVYAKQFKGVAGTIKAGKTGSLSAGWQNFASMASKDGITFYCVVLNSPDSADIIAPDLDAERIAYRPALYESAGLYSWAFGNLGIRPALNTEAAITEVPVKYSTDRYTLRLLPSQDLRTVLPHSVSDSVIQKTFTVPEFVSAPIKKGELIGQVTLTVENRVIGTADLVAAQDVERNPTLFALSKIKEFFSSPYFKIIFAVLLLAVGAYILIVVSSHKKSRQKGSAPSSKNGQNRARPPKHNAPPNKRRK